MEQTAIFCDTDDFCRAYVEHSRHRSVTDFLVNLVSAPAAYSFLPKKPSVSSDSNMQEDFLCLLD